MKCCLCKKEIPVEANGYAEGHNAEPLRKGRCCNECNLAIIIPLRLVGRYPKKKEK
jgi:hypothetical protein